MPAAFAGQRRHGHRHHSRGELQASALMHTGTGASSKILADPVRRHTNRTTRHTPGGSLRNSGPLPHSDSNERVCNSFPISRESVTIAK